MAEISSGVGKSPTITKRSLDKQAADILRYQIINGTFASGARLVEADLSKQMNLSRGTVRAALNDLVRDGLVTQTAYTKWVVAELSATDAWELFTLRSALEGLGARLAATRITKGASEQLLRVFEELKAASRSGEWGALTNADFDLHKTIVKIAGHGRLAEQYRLIEQQIRTLIGSSNALVPTTEEVVAQHRPIVEAIVAGDAVQAERLARDHNLQESDVLLEHFRKAKATLTNLADAVATGGIPGLPVA
jgi:DNA-binding GntR family transcriptional regulator